MTRWVEWSEPWPIHGTTKSVEEVRRMRWADVARVQRAREPRYVSDETAVEDFIAIHWAKVVEYP
jgi:hypothetical protein